MRRRWVALLVAILVTSAFSAESESGSVCVAPVPEKPDKLFSPDAGIVCKPEKLSLRIDTQPAVSWPLNKSVKINALDSTTRHRVVILCDGKPQQSFTFWFSPFNRQCHSAGERNGQFDGPALTNVEETARNHGYPAISHENLHGQHFSGNSDCDCRRYRRMVLWRRQRNLADSSANCRLRDYDCGRRGGETNLARRCRTEENLTVSRIFRQANLGRWKPLASPGIDGVHRAQRKGAESVLCVLAWHCRAAPVLQELLFSQSGRTLRSV